MAELPVADPPLLALPRYAVAEVPFRVASLPTAINAVRESAASLSDSTQDRPLDSTNDSPRGVAVHFANAYTLAFTTQSPDYAALFTDPATAVFTDGMPVAWFGRKFYPSVAPKWQRVYGPDVMAGVLAGPADDRVRHYLLGGSPATLAALERAIARDFPNALVVGSESPPFRPLTEVEFAERDQRLRESGATVVWVGLGTPKQDWEVARLASELPVVAMAVGAAFDFLAGVKPQAPGWVQQSGLEWAYRFASEPRRLAKRYLWGNPTFVAAAWRNRPR